MGFGKVVIVFSALLSLSCARPSDKCRDGKLYPHDTRQSMYHTCDDGVKVLKECPVGMYYNRRLGNCFSFLDRETEDIINSHARQALNALGYMPPRMKTSTSTTTTTTTTKTKPVTPRARTSTAITKPPPIQSRRKSRKRVLKKQRKKVQEKSKYVSKTGNKNGVHISVMSFEIEPALAKKLYHSKRPYGIYRSEQPADTETENEEEADEDEDSDDEETDSNNEDKDSDDEDSDSDEEESDSDSEDWDGNYHDADKDNAYKVSYKINRVPFDWNRETGDAIRYSDSSDYLSFGLGRNLDVSKKPTMKLGSTNNNALNLGEYSGILVSSTVKSVKISDKIDDVSLSTGSHHISNSNKIANSLHVSVNSGKHESKDILDNLGTNPNNRIAVNLGENNFDYDLSKSEKKLSSLEVDNNWRKSVKSNYASSYSGKKSESAYDAAMETGRILNQLFNEGKKTGKAYYYDASSDPSRKLEDSRRFKSGKNMERTHVNSIESATRLNVATNSVKNPDNKFYYDSTIIDPTRKLENPYLSHTHNTYSYSTSNKAEKQTENVQQAPEEPNNYPDGIYNASIELKPALSRKNINSTNDNASIYTGNNSPRVPVKFGLNSNNLNDVPIRTGMILDSFHKVPSISDISWNEILNTSKENHDLIKNLEDETNLTKEYIVNYFDEIFNPNIKYVDPFESTTRKVEEPKFALRAMKKKFLQLVGVTEADIDYVSLKSRNRLTKLRYPNMYLDKKPMSTTKTPINKSNYINSVIDLNSDSKSNNTDEGDKSYYDIDTDSVKALGMYNNTYKEADNQDLDTESVMFEFS